MSVIIAEKDRAFLIDFDGSITEVNDFYIHGRDTDIFYGAMHAVKEMSPRDKLKKVYEVGAKLTTYCSFPFVLIDTKKLTFEIINDK